MNAVKYYVRNEIDISRITLENIKKYPELFQPNAEFFWKGRKLQAEEILIKIINNTPNACCINK